MLEIRACTEDALDALEHHLPTGGQRVHAHHFAHQLTGNRTYLIAWAGDEPVGSCVIVWDGCIAPDTRAELPDAVEIGNVHVRADVRGRGIGTALVVAAEQQIAAKGYGLAAISVAVDNPRAATLYRRLGFVDRGLQSTSCYTYPDENGVDRDVVEHDITLTKRLSES